MYSKDYIHSGGDFRIVVASDKDVKVSPVREAFQSVLGKATVFGLAAQAASVAAQPVGFAAARQAANERIQNLQNQVGKPDIPVRNEQNLDVK
jgi:non-canonical (house-cleaning) NTP pyrophosphatase